MVTKTKIKKSEILLGKAKSYLIGETKIIISNINGSYYAIGDICSHDEGELLNGECNLIEDCLIECPRHGARFNLKTGNAVRMPAVAPIPTFKVNILKDELEILIEE